MRRPGTRCKNGLSRGWFRLVRAALQAYFDALTLAPDDGSLQQMTSRFLVLQGLDAALLQAYLHTPDQPARAAVTQQALQPLGDPK